MALPSSSFSAPAAVIPVMLELAHLHVWHAFLVHGPGTRRQIAGKSDLHLIELDPRSRELEIIGALQSVGQSGAEGAILAAVCADVNAPTATDRLERQLTTLPVQDQVSIAAGIMARHARRGKRPPDRAQSELL